MTEATVGKVVVLELGHEMWLERFPFARGLMVQQRGATGSVSR